MKLDEEGGCGGFTAFLAFFPQRLKADIFLSAQVNKNLFLLE